MNLNAVERQRLFCHLNRLQQDRHYRDTQRRYVFEGVRNVIRANCCGHQIETVLRCRKLLRSPASSAVLQSLRDSGSTIVDVTPEQFRKCSITKRASGLLAIARQKRNRIDAFTPKSIAVALSRVRYAGNFGCLIRTAAAVGADGFILIGNSIDPYDPTAIRSAMGTIFAQSFYRATWREFNQWKKQHGATVVAACPRSEVSYTTLSTCQSDVLMLGEERIGISSRQRKHSDLTVRIPMAPDCDSLNMAVAGSLLLYECRKSTLESKSIIKKQSSISFDSEGNSRG